MKKLEELWDRAGAAAREAVAPSAGCPVRADRRAGEVEWDGDLRKHVFHATFEAWAEHDKLVISLDAAGNVVSFRDARRLKVTAPPPYPDLADEDLLAIASTSGLLGPEAVVEGRRAAGPGLTAAVIRDGRAAGRRAWTFTINLVTGKLGAFDPVEEAP